MIRIKKLYILLGIGGSRKDFVTGWLGTLPTFVNTRWYINLATGGSFNDTHFVKELDAFPEKTFRDMLIEQGIDFDDASELNLAVSCHGLHLAESLKDIPSHQYEIINVEVDDQTLSTTFWEQFVKNFLRYNNTIEQLTNGNFENKTILKYVSDVDDTYSLTVDEQISIIENLYPKYDSSDIGWVDDMKNKILWCRNHDSLPVIQVDYKNLFVPGGSVALCKQINVNAPSVNHKFWDAMLPFAESPTEIEFLGKVWKKSDYIK